MWYTPMNPHPANDKFISARDILITDSVMQAKTLTRYYIKVISTCKQVFGYFILVQSLLGQFFLYVIVC